MSGLTEPLRHEIKLAEGVSMAFRLIPPGTFRMGSRGGPSDEEPKHRVVIAEGFWMAETPVTQAQFRVWIDAVGEEDKNRVPGNEDHPAGGLNWCRASQFCAWLTEAFAEAMPPPIEGDAGVRDWEAALPTEAQWEYACRAGTETEYYTGDGEAALAEAGWFGEELRSGSTRPVRLKAGNAFRLFDMHGCIIEWCADVYDRNAYRKRLDYWHAAEWSLNDAGTDAVYGSDDDRNECRPHRVQRGMGLGTEAEKCRSGFRDGTRPGFRLPRFGFRVCLVRRRLGIEQEVLP